MGFLSPISPDGVFYHGGNFNRSVECRLLDNVGDNARIIIRTKFFEKGSSDYLWILAICYSLLQEGEKGTLRSPKRSCSKPGCGEKSLKCYPTLNKECKQIINCPFYFPISGGPS